MQKVDDLWVLNDLPAGVGAGTQFKYVILAGKNPPRWENRANRNWREVEAPVVTHIWDSTQRLGRIPWAQVARDLAPTPRRAGTKVIVSDTAQNAQLMK